MSEHQRGQGKLDRNHNIFKPLIYSHKLASHKLGKNMGFAVCLKGQNFWAISHLTWVFQYCGVVMESTLPATPLSSTAPV